MVEELGSDEAAALLKAGRTLCAPDLLVAECANILWKKVRLDELKLDEADSMANLIQRAAIEMVPMRSLMAPPPAVPLSYAEGTAVMRRPRRTPAIDKTIALVTTKA